MCSIPTSFLSFQVVACMVTPLPIRAATDTSYEDSPAHAARSSLVTARLPWNSLMAVSSRQNDTPGNLDRGPLGLLPPEATRAHLLDLEPTLCCQLLPFCAWFTQDSVTIFNKNSLKLLTGPRDSQGLWQLPLVLPATGPARAPGDSSSGTKPFR